MPAADGWATRPVGLDFGAVTLAGMGAGVDLRLLTDLLPAIEGAILTPADLPEEADDDDA